MQGGEAVTPPDSPSEDEQRRAVEAMLASPLFVDRFIAALQGDENDEAVYGWMAEECAFGDGVAEKGASLTAAEESGGTILLLVAEPAA
jgi:hypothetical protein